MKQIQTKPCNKRAKAGKHIPAKKLVRCLSKRLRGTKGSIVFRRTSTKTTEIIIDLQDD